MKGSGSVPAHGGGALGRTDGCRGPQKKGRALAPHRGSLAHSPHHSRGVSTKSNCKNQ